MCVCVCKCVCVCVCVRVFDPFVLYLCPCADGCRGARAKSCGGCRARSQCYSRVLMQVLSSQVVYAS